MKAKVKSISKAQIGYLKGLYKKHGIEVSSEELEVLSSSEACDMIKGLIPENQRRDSPSDKMKKKIISMALTINWRKENNKIDMDRLNNWCNKYSTQHKVLDAHNHNELINLVTQFQNGPFTHKLKGYA